MTALLNKAARKLFLADLSRSQPCDQATSKDQLSDDRSTQCKQWSVRCASNTIIFSVVTLQGVVVDILEDGDSLIIDDGTGLGVVKGCKRLPFHTSKPQKGQYLMVVGQMQRNGRVPVLRSVKIQNLSHNVALTTMWPLEVIDGLYQHAQD